MFTNTHPLFIRIWVLRKWQLQIKISLSRKETITKRMVWNPIIKETCLTINPIVTYLNRLWEMAVLADKVALIKWEMRKLMSFGMVKNDLTLSDVMLGFCKIIISKRFVFQSQSADNIVDWWATRIATMIAMIWTLRSPQSMSLTLRRRSRTRALRSTTRNRNLINYTSNLK